MTHQNSKRYKDRLRKNFEEAWSNHVAPCGIIRIPAQSSMKLMKIRPKKTRNGASRHALRSAPSQKNVDGVSLATHHAFHEASRCQPSACRPREQAPSQASVGSRRDTGCDYPEANSLLRCMQGPERRARAFAETQVRGESGELRRSEEPHSV